MKRFFLFISFVTFSLIAFAQKSHIQVIADPGVKIFLDNRFIGNTSSDVGGLIISDLEPGTYKIKAAKENFQPQEEKLTLKVGEVKEYRVKPFTPKVTIRETGSVETQTLELKTGELKVQSLPISIHISIPTIGVKRSKKQDEWFAEDIPEGIYKVRFGWNSKVIEEEIEIVENELTHIFVDMIKEKIEYRKRAGKVGSLKVTSVPTGKLYLSGSSVGETPFEKMDMRVGNYRATLRFRLNHLEYIDNVFKLEQDFEILNGNTTNLKFDLFDSYQFGSLTVNSVKRNSQFALYNSNQRKYSNLESNFSKKFLIGDYYITVPNNPRKYHFQILDNRTTLININHPEPGISLKTVNDVPGYQSFSDYYHLKYTPYPESKRVKGLSYDWARASLFGVYSDIPFDAWPTVWSIVGNLGLVFSPTIVNYELRTFGIVCLSTYILGRVILAPLKLDNKTKSISKNILRNSQARSKYRTEYDELLNTIWEPELVKVNSGIQRKNDEIEKRNKKLERIEVNYK